MSISPRLSPINRRNTRAIEGSDTRTSVPKPVIRRSKPVCRFEQACLFALAAGSTLAIWRTDPFVGWAYEGGVFLLAAWVVLRRGVHCGPVLASAAVLSLWGFAQLAMVAPVYRIATLDESLRIAALGATALVAAEVFRREARDRLLRWFCWFGFLVAVGSVMAYYASPGLIFWYFASPYPDAWGPFLSRNNFAQFLELSLPVSLWLACTRRGTVYWWMSAVMLASGLVSASRAGAVLLIFEAGAVLVLAKPPSARRLIPVFILGVMAFAALAGGEVLVHRLRDSEPWRDRREIYASSLTMIAARPWTGYGLGNFSTVYPEFARFDPGAVVAHAHNDWLEWAVEGGWPYALVWVLAAVAMIRPAIRSVWGIGIPAIYIHGLVDDPFARIGVVAWLFILAGALESTGSESALPIRRTE